MLIDRILHLTAERLLAALPDKIPTAMVLTDPPYGIGKRYIHNGKLYWPEPYANSYSYWEWFEPIKKELERILPEKGISLVYQGFRYIGDFADEWYGAEGEGHGLITCMRHRNGLWMPDFVVAQKKLNGQMGAACSSYTVKRSVVYAAIDRYINHEHNYMPVAIVKTQKELDHLIQRFTAPGDLIIDPFSGNGSVALAAFRNGRHFLACDHYRPNVMTGLQRLKEAGFSRKRLVAS
jgi:site-specific DNA-methyltransferase (adenine-specific)